METKFFIGNYTLKFGQPYIIISATENETDFNAESIIFFEGYDGQQTFLANRVVYPKLPGRTLDNFISTEIQSCKDDIFHKILYKKYKTELEKNMFNVQIEFIETNNSVIGFLNGKFPHILNNIKNKTKNEFLKNEINLYQSIKIE